MPQMHCAEAYEKRMKGIGFQLQKLLKLNLCLRDFILMFYDLFVSQISL